ncbi:NosD domain-containing protein [Methanosphaerula subterraneus]|uniref:NosD domain-containing protein n=1 Tax=Methanosphaerula subterraneus TaxID=3350244 RepID=UPI003F870BD5
MLLKNLFLLLFIGCCLVSVSSAGSATPITNPVWITQPGTYELQNDLTDIGTTAIEVRCSDVILDGRGFTITGDEFAQGNVAGIRVRSTTGGKLNNITVKNCQVSKYLDGILFENVDNSEIHNNVVINNGKISPEITSRNGGTGISINLSDNNNIFNNHITGVRGVGPNIGVYIFGVQNRINENTLDVQEDGGYSVYGLGGIFTSIDLTDFDTYPTYPNTIINNTLTGYTNGICIYGSGSIVKNNTLKDNRGYYGTSETFYDGCAIYSQFSNQIIGNIILNGPVKGIQFINSDYRMEIRDNTISGTSGSSAISFPVGVGNIENNSILNNKGIGIKVGEPYIIQPQNNVNIINNRIENNSGGGINIEEVYVTAVRNRIINNGAYGICFKNSNGNKIYNNIFGNQNNVKFQGDFIGNTWNVAKTAGPNILGGGFIGGNYWASPSGNGWSETHLDSDGDGICDQPYAVYLGDIDQLPLAKATQVPEVVLVPGGSGVPGDLNGDGRYNDVNGNGQLDFADVVLYFNQMDWIADNEPVASFDFNGNSQIDFADIVTLFNTL